MHFLRLVVWLHSNDTSFLTAVCEKLVFKVAEREVREQPCLFVTSDKLRDEESHDSLNLWEEINYLDMSC